MAIFWSLYYIESIDESVKQLQPLPKRRKQRLSLNINNNEIIMIIIIIVIFHHVYFSPYPLSNTLYQ